MNEPGAPYKVNITESMKYLDGKVKEVRDLADTCFFAMADESFFSERLIDAFGQADAALRRLEFELIRTIRQRENMMGGDALSARLEELQETGEGPMPSYPEPITEEMALGIRHELEWLQSIHREHFIALYYPGQAIFTTDTLNADLRHKDYQYIIRLDDDFGIKIAINPHWREQE